MTSSADPLYFAHGSTLNLDDWHRWCAGQGYPHHLLEQVGPADLPDHRLVFDGALDIRPSRGHVTRGMLFRVRPGGWDALDARESVPHAAGRFATTAVREDGSDVPVVAYRGRPDPSRRRGDLDVVRAGRRAFGLGHEDLDVLAAGERPEPVDAVFVYGTLMRGEPRFDAFERDLLRCVLLAGLPGCLVDLREYPGLVLTDQPGWWVHGEYIRHADIAALLERLDAVEGFRGFGAAGSLYRRTLVNVAVGDGRLRRAWAYVYAAGGRWPVVASGDWRAHRGTQRSFLERLAAAYGDGDEVVAARAVTARPPVLPPEEVPGSALGLLPLARALQRGEVSEHALARATRKWVVIP